MKLGSAFPREGVRRNEPGLIRSAVLGMELAL
jgi:hypothetical protein